jgi:hypothetical protein
MSDDTQDSPQVPFPVGDAAVTPSAAEGAVVKPGAAPRKRKRRSPTKPLMRQFTSRKPTPQQQAFIDHLLSGMEPHAAALQAGYCARGNGGHYDEHKAASMLLGKKHIQAGIKEARERERQIKASIRPEMTKAEVEADLDEAVAQIKAGELSGWQATALLQAVRLKAQMIGLLRETSPTEVNVQTQPSTISVAFVAGPNVEPVGQPPILEGEPAESKLLPTPAPESGTMNSRTCEVGHGSYIATWERLAPGLMGWSHCPQCAEKWEQDNRKERESFVGLIAGEPAWRA